MTRQVQRQEECARRNEAATTRSHILVHVLGEQSNQHQTVEEHAATSCTKPTLPAFAPHDVSPVRSRNMLGNAQYINLLADALYHFVGFSDCHE